MSQPAAPALPPPPRHRLSAIHALLAAILLASFLLKLNHLGHPSLKPLDEVFHAIVARNFLKHPLTPTLIDHPFLSYNYTDWQSTDIWLHKPPMALWQIALSFALFGVNTLALRLPSAILSTAAAGLTYGIGAELLDRRAGLIAAALQAFNPVILMLVNGYVFSDHVDISLLFWTELAIWFLARGLRTGRAVDWIACGVAQGLAFLSKTYPALIVSGIALVAWLLPLLSLAHPPKRAMRWPQLLLILATTALTVLPWMLWIRLRFPAEFAHENSIILSHLSQDVEGWARPWDCVLFDYWISIFYIFYPATLAALLLLCGRAAGRRTLGLWLVVAWALGMLLPHLLATSKTMSATLAGWPAMWLLLGYLISLALDGQLWALGAWATAMILAGFLKTGAIPTGGADFASHPAGEALRAHTWVVWQTLAAIAGGGVLWLARRWIGRGAFRAIVISAAVVTLLLGVRWWRGERPRGYAYLAWEVTQQNKQKPAFAALGRYLQKLPPDAAMLVDERSKLESLLVAFPADHTCYPLGRRTWQQAAAALVRAGALPYFVSPDRQPLPVVYVDGESQRIVYACTPAALAAGKRAARELAEP